MIILTIVNACFAQLHTQEGHLAFLSPLLLETTSAAQNKQSKLEMDVLSVYVGMCLIVCAFHVSSTPGKQMFSCAFMCILFNFR